MTRGRWIAALAALLMPGLSLAATTGSEPLLNQQNRPWQPTTCKEPLLCARTPWHLIVFANDDDHDFQLL
jgi:hypothetical protein